MMHGLSKQIQMVCTQWEKKFGPANQGLSIQQTSDDGFVLVAEVEDTVFGGYLNAWMVKIDHNGE